MNRLNRSRIGRLALVLPAFFAVSACRSQAREEEAPAVEGETVVIEQLDDTTFVAVREIWISMADEPIHHMRRARELFDSGDRKVAAREFDKSASLFRWGRRSAVGARDRAAFLTTAQELEEVARMLRIGAERDNQPLHRVLAKGYRVMAAHHVGLAVEEWNAGEHVRVAVLLRAAADEVGRGFALSGEPAGGTIEEALKKARSVADRLETTQPPSEPEVREAMRGLREASAGLAEVLGSRRR